MLVLLRKESCLALTCRALISEEGTQLIHGPILLSLQILSYWHEEMSPGQKSRPSWDVRPPSPRGTRSPHELRYPHPTDKDTEASTASPAPRTPQLEGDGAQIQGVGLRNLLPNPGTPSHPGSSSLAWDLWAPLVSPDGPRDPTVCLQNIIRTFCGARTHSILERPTLSPRSPPIPLTFQSDYGVDRASGPRSQPAVLPPTGRCTHLFLRNPGRPTVLREAHTERCPVLRVDHRECPRGAPALIREDGGAGAPEAPSRPQPRSCEVGGSPGPARPGGFHLLGTSRGRRLLGSSPLRCAPGRARVRLHGLGPLRRGHRPTLPTPCPAGETLGRPSPWGRRSRARLRIRGRAHACLPVTCPGDAESPRRLTGLAGPTLASPSAGQVHTPTRSFPPPRRRLL